MSTRSSAMVKTVRSNSRHKFRHPTKLTESLSLLSSQIRVIDRSTLAVKHCDPLNFAHSDRCARKIEGSKGVQENPDA